MCWDVGGALICMANPFRPGVCQQLRAGWAKQQSQHWCSHGCRCLKLWGQHACAAAGVSRTRALPLIALWLDAGAADPHPKGVLHMLARVCPCHSCVKTAGAYCMHRLAGLLNVEFALTMFAKYLNSPQKAAWVEGSTKTDHPRACGLAAPCRMLTVATATGSV